MIKKMLFRSLHRFQAAFTLVFVRPQVSPERGARERIKSAGLALPCLPAGFFFGSRRAGRSSPPLLFLTVSSPAEIFRQPTRGNISIFDFESETPPVPCTNVHACFPNPAQFLASSLAWCRFRSLIQTGSFPQAARHPRQTPALCPHLTPPTQETKGSERSSRLERAHRRSIDEKASAERERVLGTRAWTGTREPRQK